MNERVFTPDDDAEQPKGKVPLLAYCKEFPLFDGVDYKFEVEAGKPNLKPEPDSSDFLYWNSKEG